MPDLPKVGRRGLAAGAAWLAGGGIARAQAQTGSIAVTLLGTGSPQLNPSRFGPSTLVQAGGLNLLFDAGRGCTIRLNQLHIPLGAIDPVFVTHYHSDHTTGLPDLWLTGFIQAPYLGRKRPLRVFGPPGAVQLCQHLQFAYADDVRIRIADEGTPETATGLIGTECPESGGVVFDESGVRVTAFPVNHGDLIRPAVGYRIDHAGRSVLLSGDTRYDERVVQNGIGVDLLIHEVCTMPPELAEVPQARAVAAHHTNPEEAGRIFAMARPRMAAFSHIVEIARAPRFPAVPTAEIEAQTRLNYDGPLTLGTDLTRFTIGDTVVVERLTAPTTMWPG